MRESEKFLLRLGDYHIMNLDEHEASPEQIYKLWSFMNILCPYRLKTLFARGESDENLQKHYLYDTHTLPQLLNTIFYIGEKGRLCLNDNEWIDPDDINTDNFIKIYNLMNSVLKSAEKGSAGRVQRMKEFIAKNSSFVKSFLTDKKTMITRYQKLSSEKRKMANIYYLSIIHTINSYIYKTQSAFLSTSQDIDVAEQFEESLLLIGWLPKHRELSYIASRHTDSYKSVCISVNLPIIETSVYPEQAEISVRYGVLPHFIIGVKVKNNFYVNPALYETMQLFSVCTSIKQMKQLRSDIIAHGFIINQDRFLEYCKNSNYLRYFTYDGVQYRIHNLY